MLETPSSSPVSVSVHDLSELTADPNNARLHNQRNLEAITSSLQEVGAARSIVIDEDGVILAGNATAEAAQKAGMTRVQIVEADGDAIIAVRRRNLIPQQKTRLALSDNRAGELSAFDPLMLAGLQAEGVSLEGLWTGDELDALLADMSLADMSLADISLADLTAMDELTADRFPEPSEAHKPSEAYKQMLADRAGSGAARDREYEEEVRLRRENTQDTDRQEREVSPRPPSADTEPFAPTAGLDRVTPDQETSKAGLFLHFRGLKIPLSAEEGAALDTRLAEHREAAGTYYGFIASLLNDGAGKESDA